MVGKQPFHCSKYQNIFNLNERSNICAKNVHARSNPLKNILRNFTLSRFQTISSAINQSRLNQRRI